MVTGSPADRLNLLPAALEHVLAQKDGKARCLKAVRELSQAFALAVPHPETVRIRDDVSLFQHVRAALSKRPGPSPQSDEELDHAVRQIVSRAVASDGVVDIFAAAGLKKPDVSVLSEDFLGEVRGMRRRNLAVELMEKLLKGELATRRRKNVVQARSEAPVPRRALQESHTPRTPDAERNDPSLKRQDCGATLRRVHRLLGVDRDIDRRPHNDRSRDSDPRCTDVLGHSNCNPHRLERETAGRRDDVLAHRQHVPYVERLERVMVEDGRVDIHSTLSMPLAFRSTPCRWIRLSFRHRVQSVPKPWRSH